MRSRCRGAARDPGRSCRRSTIRIRTAPTLRPRTILPAAPPACRSASPMRRRRRDAACRRPPARSRSRSTASTLRRSMSGLSRIAACCAPSSRSKCTSKKAALRRSAPTLRSASIRSRSLQDRTTSIRRSSPAASSIFAQRISAGRSRFSTRVPITRPAPRKHRSLPASSPRRPGGCARFRNRMRRARRRRCHFSVHRSRSIATCCCRSPSSVRCGSSGHGCRSFAARLRPRSRSMPKPAGGC